MFDYPDMRLLLVWTLGLALIASACDRDAAVDGEYIDMRDLSYGDCFTRKHLDALEWATVLVVPCESDDWAFVMLNRFATSYDGPYPSDDFFWDEADRQCESGWSTFLMPTEDTWRFGDRVVWCLAEPGFPAGSGV